MRDRLATGICGLCLVFIGLVCGAGLLSFDGNALSAQTPVVLAAYLQPVSHDTLAPTNSVAIALSAAVRNPTNAGPAKVCHIGPIETNSIRYWLDGTLPTSSVGHLKPTASEFDVNGETAIAQFRIIGSAGSASVPVTCSR